VEIHKESESSQRRSVIVTFEFFHDAVVHMASGILCLNRCSAYHGLSHVKTDHEHRDYNRSWIWYAHFRTSGYKWNQRRPWPDFAIHVPQDFHTFL
jgi:hypothetical protein